MKPRLMFFAFAFFALAALAYFLHTARESNENVAEAAPSSSPIASVSSSAESAPPAKEASLPDRQSASAPSNPSPGVPATESAALGYLQSNSKRSWDLKRDDFSNHIRTLSGGELPSKKIIAREAADEFVNFYSQGLFGVDPSRVKFNREEVTDRTRLIYEQVVDGTAVYGGSLSLFFENGSLTRVQNDMAPFDIEPTSKPSPVTEAFLAYKQIQSPLAEVSLQTHPSNRTVLYSNGRSLVYAYEFVTNETDKGAGHSPKSFHVLFDADDKFIIQRRASAIR